MTRPRTGQRKPARSPAGSAALTELSSAAGTWVGEASRALCGDSIVATLDVVCGAAGASARGATGAAGGGTARASRISGMTMRSPTFTVV